METIKILFGYDYIDSTGFAPKRVVVKSRIITTDKEMHEYISKIREKYNVKNLPYDQRYKKEKLKLKEYELQKV